jgi:hypothetical protein
LAKKVVDSAEGIFVMPDVIDLLCIAIGNAPIFHIRVEALHIRTIKRQNLVNVHSQIVAQLGKIIGRFNRPEDTAILMDEIRRSSKATRDAGIEYKRHVKEHGCDSKWTDVTWESPHRPIPLSLDVTQFYILGVARSNVH